ncbi:MAG TPA: aminotransferase class V-fold PLP-dependent enzyme, partial [Thermomicrobiales bacterium]|nr:aminotransferase class V-fold PLP-dependent enzyme [Thermomicrobiales bacterium]
MDDLLRATSERAAHYLAGLADRAVAPAPEAIARLGTLGGPLPDGPSDPADVIGLLDGIGSPATTATAGGRYFGFVIGGTLPAALAASWLATTWDNDAGMSLVSPVGAAVEEIARSWLLDVLRLPADSGIGFVTGGTMANLTCLAAARMAVLARVGWDVEADGLFGAPPVTVVVGAEAHISVFKALGLLGFGRERVLRVPVDDQGRMLVEELHRLDGPSIVCAQAGNVNSGAVDPIGAIAERVHRDDAWLHIDGAFGLWAAAAPERAHLVAGADAADSWAIDGHKWLNVPYDSGIAIVRDAGALRRAMAASASYLVASDNREPDQYTPEMSRRARGVEAWAALRSLGRSGLADLVERCCRHATRFADGLASAGYQILNEVTLNQVLVSFGDDATTRRVIAAIQADGTCWCGGTTWQGRAAMRISVSSWATTDEDA